jgi:phage terminase large subunit
MPQPRPYKPQEPAWKQAQRELTAQRTLARRASRKRATTTVRDASRKPSAVEFPWPLRDYQQAALSAFDAGKRRQMLAWHRRAGKDIFGMSLARRQSQRDVGGYWHFYPKHVQAKRAIWNGVDPRTEKKFIDVAFGDLIEHQNNTDMFLELRGGSTWQLLGSDNYDRMMGGNARGVVFSEWALCDPRAWDYIRPIILENKGWAVFISTFRGRNHCWQMFRRMSSNAEWYVDLRPVTATHDVSGNRIITDADIQRERDEGMSERLIQQEYFCNPAAAVPGAVYALATERLKSNATRAAATWDALRPVYACWSFKHSPTSSAVAYVQPGPRPRILGGELFPHATVGDCVAALRERPWRVTEHLVRESESAVVEVLDGFRVYPDVVREELLAPGRVEAVTQAFVERADADSTSCEDVFDSLTGYKRVDMSEDENRPVFSESYETSWTNQLANAVELAAVSLQEDGTEWQRGQSYRNQDRRAV